MTGMDHKNRRRGFTLVELMIVVAIIGILASIAIPTFTRAQLRTKAAERGVIMNRFKKALDDRIVREGRVKPPGDAAMTADYQPPLPAFTSRRVPNWRAPGWAELDMEVEGNLYHSYLFVAWDNADGEGVELQAVGDLDGDGALSVTIRRYQVGAAGILPTFAWPTPGQEDDAGPNMTF